MVRMTRSIYVLAVLLFAVTGVFAQCDIHQVNFKNFTYLPYCAGEEPEKVTAKNGEFSSEKQMDGYADRIYFNVTAVNYGDLTGDGVDDAVVLTVCNTGGTGNFSEGFIYSIKNGKPVLAARIAGGDRAYGGLHSAKVENGLLVVERYNPGETGGACCPEILKTSKYRLATYKLVENGKPSSRDLYPKQRINFAKGTSGTTFKSTVPGGELKRFVVGARSGQTLTVSFVGPDGALRLLDDVEVNEGINNFVAKLPRSGDFVFEIQNLAEASRDFTITVRIR